MVFQRKMYFLQYLDSNDKTAKTPTPSTYSPDNWKAMKSPSWMYIFLYQGLENKNVIKTILSTTQDQDNMRLIIQL